MKIEILAPHMMECENLSGTKEKVTLTPRFHGRGGTARVAYIRAIGDDGKELNVAVMYSRTGRFTLQRLTATGAVDEEAPSGESA